MTSCSKHKYKPSYDFPEELLSEIFKRLPVKDVLRCRAVQKSWYHLIKTPLFISQHCSHQKLTTQVNPKYLLFHNTSTHLYTVRSDDSQSREYCTFDYPLELPTCSWGAQSNGLMCVSTMFNKNVDYDPKIFIWNPLVKKIRSVPYSPHTSLVDSETTEWEALAFGYLPDDNDYVVVDIFKLGSTAPDPPDYFDPYSPDDYYEQAPHTVMIGVYSLNTDSWKVMSQDKVFVDFMCTNQSVFVNGTAFWVGYNCDVSCQLVMFFDTKTNILRQVEVPYWVVSHPLQLKNPLILPFGQSIAYFVEGDQDDLDCGDDDEDDKSRSPHLDIWELKMVMIGDEDKIPWEKTMGVKLSENVWAEVLGTRNNGEPIQARSNDLISYHLDTHEPYDFVKSCDHLTPRYYHEKGCPSSFSIRPFVETLFLLDAN